MSNQVILKKHKIWKIGEIELGYACSDFSKNKEVLAVNDKNLVRLHFGLRGDYQFTYKEIGKSFDLAGGHHNIMYSKGLELEIQAKTMIVETFGVSFKPEAFLQTLGEELPFLENFIKKIQMGSACILSEEWGRINTPIQRIIDEIIRNNYTGKMQELFLRAKVLELLVLCLEDYQKANALIPVFIKNPKDKEKIIAARDYLNQRIVQPPAISEVARAVGLNEFKLKNGFKELFGCTMFHYLTEQRLHLAKKFLLETNDTAAEIAYQLGYSSPQHFHKQFKKRFACTPDFMRKNS